MPNRITRRALLGTTPLIVAQVALGAQSREDVATSKAVDPHFPSQDPTRVREMVTVSHGNLQRVRELVEASPALAKATWDWGFGDWETALGAASHTGSRRIAELLIANGARPDIFTFAMFGRLEVVKAYVQADPGIQRTPGPHGITLLSHAEKGGEQAAGVLEYLTSLGDADIGPESMPLSDDEKKTYVGEYAFGAGPENRLRIEVSRGGLLGIRRGPKGTMRRLLYLGDHAFHPAGAPAVRVRFTVREGVAVKLSVHDPEPILEARRAKA